MNISSSTSTSLSKEFPDLYSGPSRSSSSLSANLEQKIQLEKKFTIKNIEDISQALAQIPRKVLQLNSIPRHPEFLKPRDVSFCSNTRIIFSDGEELSGKFIRNGNTIVDVNKPRFFNSDPHKKFKPLHGTKVGLRSEFEAVTIEPFNKCNSTYLEVKITIWDISSSQAKEKKSWTVSLEQVLGFENSVLFNPIDSETHFNISEDGNWLLISVSQKDSGKDNYIYSIVDKKIIRLFKEDLEIATEYFLPEGYLVTGTAQSDLAVCRFISINEKKWKSWLYPGADVLDYNNERVLIRGQDGSNLEHLITINPTKTQSISFPTSERAKLCDNFIISFGSKNCTIQDIGALEKYSFDKMNCTNEDLRATRKYSVGPHFSESVIFLDVLIKANKINIFYKEREKKQLVQFEFTEPKKLVFANFDQTFFGKKKFLPEISKMFFTYLDRVDLNVTICVSRGWRDLTKLTVLTRLHSFINIPGKNALIYNKSLGHSYDSRTLTPAIRGRDHLFLPTADLPGQQEIRQKIANEWEILAYGEKYAFAKTGEPHIIAVFDMDSDSQEIKFLNLGADVVGFVPKGKNGFLTLTNLEILTEWSINQTNNAIFQPVNISLFKLYNEERIINFFSTKQNNYIVVTYFESTEKYFISTFNWDKGNISSLKRYEFPVSSIAQPTGYEVDELERNYTFFYQNGLLFFTWENVDETPNLNLATFSIEADKLELVWSKECFQNTTLEHGTPKIILHHEDYIVISGVTVSTSPDVEEFVSRPLTVLETKTGKTVVTLWIDQLDGTDPKFTAFISRDLLGIQGTSSLNEENTINLYHLTTGQFLGRIAVGNKEIRDMKLLLDHAEGPRLRFLCCETVDESDEDESEEDDDESQEVDVRIDIWVADILLKSPKDTNIATIPRNFLKKTDVQLCTENLKLNVKLNPS